MKILLTGACGFVGSTLVRAWQESGTTHEFTGVDSLIRPGSETNREDLVRRGVKLIHADLRSQTDTATLPRADWVIEAAANPSVLAGVDGKTNSRQLMEHNFWTTVNMLEYCRQTGAGFILLSTSRVYSLAALSGLSMSTVNQAFVPDLAKSCPVGLSAAGVAEEFSTDAPASLYGASKLISERIALEYGQAFGFPVWIDRCGVLAGAGQFGHAEQGIVSYWIAAWASRRPLTYIGFGGNGHQVRDVLHPRDLIPVLDRQMQSPSASPRRIFNLSGGVRQAVSLRALSDWCAERFGPREVTSDANPRPFDVPWLVLDSARAEQALGFRPTVSLPRILQEIADFVEHNPGWLDRTSGR